MFKVGDFSHFYGLDPIPENPLYQPSKNESGKEKVKLFNLYQALTKDELWGGKENGSDKVFCLVVLKFVFISNSCQLMARANRTSRFPVRVGPIFGPILDRFWTDFGPVWARMHLVPMPSIIRMECVVGGASVLASRIGG